MTKSAHWLGAGVLACCFAALSACGSKGGAAGNGNNGSTPLASACLGPSFSSACESCLQSSCASTLGSFASDCSDYVQCYCPGGAFNASAQTSQTCVAKAAANPSCLTSVQAMNTCVTQTCANVCGSSGGGSGGSTSGGGGGGGGGGSGGGGGTGGPTPACGIEFTTAACASCVMAECCSVTQTCAQDQACLSVITCMHQCGGSTSCEQSCVSSAAANAQMELNAAGSCWTNSCTHSGC
ncbi:MAG TPA: hypothetical protein VF765_04250 [Polyangiaceae bacterium]